MRNNDWLLDKLNLIWGGSFPDIDRKNKVIIRFGRKSKSKFGHITKKNGETKIVINKFFSHEEVPEFIVDLTIAHELVHYAHGFHSPYEKMFAHPHKGGIVNKELAVRGLGSLIKMEKEWAKKEWPRIYKQLASGL